MQQIYKIHWEVERCRRLSKKIKNKTVHKRRLEACSGNPSGKGSSESRERIVGQLGIIEMDPAVHSQPLELHMYEVYVDVDFASTVLG